MLSSLVSRVAGFQELASKMFRADKESPEKGMRFVNAEVSPKLKEINGVGA